MLKQALITTAIALPLTANAWGEYRTVGSEDIIVDDSLTWYTFLRLGVDESGYTATALSPNRTVWTARMFLNDTFGIGKCVTYEGLQRAGCVFLPMEQIEP